MGARLGLCALRAHFLGGALPPSAPCFGVWGSGALPPPAPFGWSASRGRRWPALGGRALRSRFSGWGVAPLRPLPPALPPLLFVRSVGVALVAVHPVPVVAVVSSLFRGACPEREQGVVLLLPAPIYFGAHCLHYCFHLLWGFVGRAFTRPGVLYPLISSSVGCTG